MSALDNTAMQALSDAGAQCGDCGDQPGDRICPACELHYGWCVAALRTAGWAPRVEVLNEAAEVAVRFARACGDSEAGQYAASVAARIGAELRLMAAAGQAPAPQPETAPGAAMSVEPLSDDERTMLTFALDLAQDAIYSRGDEFTDEDQAAVHSLRRMTAGGAS